MPQPTKEQFDAAAQKVMKTAPAGLSREQFFALIDKELAGGYQTDEGTRAATIRAIARQSGGIVPTQAIKDELGNDVNGTSSPLLKGFVSNMVRNPILQGAAHPTGLGDMVPLLLPQGALAVTSKLKGYATALKQAGSEPGMTGIWKPIRRAGDIVAERGGMADRAKLGVHVNMPNKSATPSGDFGPSASDIPPVIDRYMPNISSAEPGMATSHDRIPYGAPPPEPQFTAPGQVVGRAPSLEDELVRVIDAIRAEGGGKPPLVSSHPSTLETAGEGALKQSGKFGKSGSKGQPGGYSSGRPPATASRMDEILNNLGGRGDKPSSGEVSSPPLGEATPAAGNISEPTSDLDFHSGAEQGSPDAKSAQSLHRDLGAMDADYKRKMADPLASILASLIGEESLRHMMSSHGE